MQEKLSCLRVGYSLRAPELLFRKIEDEEIKTQMEKLKAGMPLNHTVLKLAVASTSYRTNRNRKYSIR